MDHSCEFCGEAAAMAGDALCEPCQSLCWFCGEQAVMSLIDRAANLYRVRVCADCLIEIGETA